MIAEVLILGLQVATLVAMADKGKAKEEPKKEKVETKVAPRKEPKISNSGERFVHCPVYGYQSKYRVGDWGTVKNVNGDVLRQYKNPSGKMVVTIYKNGTQTTYTVERLVALAYLPRPAMGDERTHKIIHKNGDVGDNRAVNLMWK